MFCLKSIKKTFIYGILLIGKSKCDIDESYMLKPLTLLNIKNTVLKCHLKSKKVQNTQKMKSELFFSFCSSDVL